MLQGIAYYRGHRVTSENLGSFVPADSIAKYQERLQATPRRRLRHQDAGSNHSSTLQRPGRTRKSRPGQVNRISPTTVVHYNVDTLLDVNKSKRSTSKQGGHLLPAARLVEILRLCSSGLSATVVSLVSHRWTYTGKLHRDGWTVFSFGAPKSGQPVGCLLAFDATVWNPQGFLTPHTILAGRAGAIRYKWRRGIQDLAFITALSPGDDHSEADRDKF